MATTLEQAERIINELSPEDRHQLLDHLLSEKESLERAWIAEADGRLKEIEEGKVKTIPGDQVLSEGRRRLREKF